MRFLVLVFVLLCSPFVAVAGDCDKTPPPPPAPKVEVVKDCDCGGSKFKVMTKLTGVTGVTKITIIGKKLGGFFCGSSCDCK